MKTRLFGLLYWILAPAEWLAWRVTGWRLSLGRSGRVPHVMEAPK